MKKIDYKGFIKAILYIILGSTTINILLAVLGRHLSHVPSTFSPYMISSISGMNILGVIAASVVYFLFAHFNKNMKKANHAYMKLSILLLIISFIPDLVLPLSGDAENVGWTSWWTIFNLMLMHTVTAFFVIRTFVYRNKFVN
jgi:NADH:ubiquinone oxidoreductase subunit 3 (subunit A)